VAGRPNRRAAIATAWAWFPDDGATTPRGGDGPSASFAIAFVAPLALKAPPTWKFSAFMTTVAPTSPSIVLDVSTGVRCTNGPMRSAAARTSSIVTDGTADAGSAIYVTRVFRTRPAR
jgi:hypothetical protein